MGEKLGTVALPGMLQPRITQGTRIAVGEKLANKNHPDKLDHIRLAKWDSSIGDGGSYVMDAEAMQLLAEWYGVAYDREYAPDRVPIWLLANPESVPDPVTPGAVRPEIPRSVLWTRMARYGKRGAVCSCEGFELLTPGVAKQLGLDWPLDPNARESWRGEAFIRDWPDGKLHTSRQVCYPPLCPYANGANGTVTCKPQTIFRCVLPFLPALGVVAEYHTTSVQATQRLRGSLLKIAAFSGGWLMMLGNPEERKQQPFIELVMVDRRVGGNNYHAPILHAEYRGTMQTIGEATIATRQMLGDLQTRLAAIEAPEGPLALDSGEGAYAWQHEMLPESLHDESEPGLEELARDYARRAGWSAAKLNATIRKHGDDEAAWEGVLRELQEALGMPVFAAEEAGPVQGVGYAPEEADEQHKEAQDADFEDEQEQASAEEPAPDDADAMPAEAADPADEYGPVEEPPMEAYDDPPAVECEQAALPPDYEEPFPEAPEVQAAAQRQARPTTKAKRLFDDGGGAGS